MKYLATHNKNNAQFFNARANADREFHSIPVTAYGVRSHAVTGDQSSARFEQIGGQAYLMAFKGDV